MKDKNSIETDRVLLDIIRIMGPQKASHLFMGEPVMNHSAWQLLEYIRKNYDYETIYEDEEGEEAECYAVLLRFGEKYMYALIKDHGSSKGYLLVIINTSDVKITRNLIIDEFEKCVERNKKNK